MLVLGSREGLDSARSSRGRCSASLLQIPRVITSYARVELELRGVSEVRRSGARVLGEFRLDQWGSAIDDDGLCRGKECR
jgi:hypothetical protein